MAEQPQDRLKSVEQDLERGEEKVRALNREADQLASELLSAQRRSVEVAAEVMQREAEVQSLEDRLRELAAREAEKSKNLKDRRRQYVRVMMAVSQMARHPPEAILAQPLSPRDTLRSTLLLRTVAPKIEDLAAVLRADLEDINAAKTEIAARRSELETLSLELKEEKEALKVIQAEKRKARANALASAEIEQKRMEKLAKDAKSLKELLRKINAVKRQRAAEEKVKAARALNKPKLAPVVPKAKPDPQKRDRLAGYSRVVPKLSGGGMRGLPVVGRLVQSFGAKEAGGFKARGIRVETRPGAQVIAPGAGTIAFAGPFRGYGGLLIIDHGDDYHSLIAGLDRIDAKLGEAVMSGEPIGVIGSKQSGLPTLYFELRRKGQPINPLPWLASQSNGRR